MLSTTLLLTVLKIPCCAKIIQFIAEIEENATRKMNIIS